MNYEAQLGEEERRQFRGEDMAAMAEGGLALTMREMRSELDGHAPKSCSVCACEVSSGATCILSSSRRENDSVLDFVCVQPR